MKRMLTIISVIIIVVIVVIAGNMITSVHSNDEKSIKLKIGYFLTYNCTSVDMFTNNLTTYDISYEIIADQPSLCKETMSTGEISYINFDDYGGECFPFISKVHEVDEGATTSEFIGKENIESDWGVITTEHYLISDVISPPSGFTEDRFLYHDIVVKSVQHSYYSSYTGSLNMVLINTNIPEITELESG